MTIYLGSIFLSLTSQLVSATIFIHADASRHCPLITNVLQKTPDEILSALYHPTNTIQGYLSLSKVFLNQSYSFLKQFNLGILELSNEIVTIKCEYYQQQFPNHETDTNSACTIPKSTDFPPYTTTYTSGSFIVARNNILAFPKSFYQQLYDKLYHGEQWVDTTCGALEYVWTTIWGGIPWKVQPNYVNNWCGSLYYADISSNSGFMFYKSDDGSVEEGYLPEKYHGVIYDRDNDQITIGKYRYYDEEEE